MAFAVWAEREKRRLELARRRVRKAGHQFLRSAWTVLRCLRSVEMFGAGDTGARFAMICRVSGARGLEARAVARSSVADVRNAVRDPGGVQVGPKGIAISRWSRPAGRIFASIRRCRRARAPHSAGRSVARLYPDVVLGGTSGQSRNRDRRQCVAEVLKQVRRSGRRPGVREDPRVSRHAAA